MRVPIAVLLLGLSAGCGHPQPTAPAAEIPRPASLVGFAPELRELLEQCQARVAATPADATGWLELGMAYEAHGMLDLAEPCYAESAQLDGSSAKTWYRLGLTHAQNGRLSEALAAMERCLEHEPGYLPAWLRQASWQVELGEHAAAEQSLARARALAPDDPECAIGQAQLELARGGAQAALDALAAPGLLEGPNAAFVHKLRGSALARLGRSIEAETELALGRDGRPRYVDPWTQELTGLQRGPAQILSQAMVLLGQGRTQDAIERLETLQRSGAVDLRVRERLASAYAQAGELPRAIELLQGIVAEEPGIALNHVRLAEAWSVAGEPMKSLAAAESALAVDQRCPEAHAARVLALLALDRQEEGLAAWKEGRSQGLADGLVEIEVGKAAMQLERMEDARACFELASAHRPEVIDAWIGLAILSHHYQDNEAALRAVQRAKALDPTNAMVPILEAELEGASAAGGTQATEGGGI